MTSEIPLIDRFHRALVETIRSDAPSYLTDTFTVAEIYQSLVPYRTHRDRLGIEMNGDYEDALLRLLVGEGGFLILESDAVKKRIRKELDSRNPNTGIYREFAAVEVRLDPQRVPDDIEVGMGLGRSKDGASVDPGLQTSLGDLEASAGPTPDAPSDVEWSRGEGKAPEAAVVGATEGGAPSDCPDCGRDLPDRDSLRYCPHCGTNVVEQPCHACGEMLERAWMYCLACGTPTRD